jgi:hypothetical protein
VAHSGHFRLSYASSSAWGKTTLKKNLVVLALAALMLFLVPLKTLTAQRSSGECSCKPPKGGETTHWVGNQIHVSTEKHSYRTLQGTVTELDERPVSDALVEVFTNPQKSEGQRVAACRTGPDGKFCFIGLASGRYELRASSGDSHAGWDVSKVYVVVNRATENKKDLRVVMRPAT